MTLEKALSEISQRGLQLTYTPSDGEVIDGLLPSQLYVEVNSQSIPADTKVPIGTTITIRVRASNN